MPRTPAKPEELCEIYIDESSQTKNRYLIMGGMICEHLLRDNTFNNFKTARLPELPHAEMKWGKVSKSKLTAYKRVVDAFWDSEYGNQAHFHSIIIDTFKYDHKRFNEGSREIGFCKEIYQLASKFGNIYGNYFHVYLDERNSSQKPDELRLILNRGFASKGDKRDWPYRRCQFRNSKICPALQLVDLFIGAIGYHMNEHVKAKDASPARTELAQYILNRAKIKNIQSDTSRTGKFTVWHRQLKGK